MKTFAQSKTVYAGLYCGVRIGLQTCVGQVVPHSAIFGHFQKCADCAVLYRDHYLSQCCQDAQVDPI